MTDAERLVEAENAYHDLVTGRSPRVFVDQNGERIEYNAANRQGLRQYIEELKARIGGVTMGGPLRVVL